MVLKNRVSTFCKNTLTLYPIQSTVLRWQGIKFFFCGEEILARISVPAASAPRPAAAASPGLEQGRRRLPSPSPPTVSPLSQPADAATAPSLPLATELLWAAVATRAPPDGGRRLSSFRRPLALELYPNNPSRRPRAPAGDPSCRPRRPQLQLARRPASGSSPMDLGLYAPDLGHL
jgi:hypothetical protein